MNEGYKKRGTPRCKNVKDQVSGTPHLELCHDVTEDAQRVTLRVGCHVLLESVEHTRQQGLARLGTVKQRVLHERPHELQLDEHHVRVVRHLGASGVLGQQSSEW